jgi:recombinational DNA repair ATPase RecF
MAVLSLKLAPYFLIEDPEKKPILVLDDVASELDETHTKNLFAFIKTLGQVFVTATEIQTPDAAVIDVSEGKATRRK